jgi:hypothetical protein
MSRRVDTFKTVPLAHPIDYPPFDDPLFKSLRLAAEVSGEGDHPDLMASITEGLLFSIHFNTFNLTDAEI